MRSYLTEKGYLEALEQENLEPSIIAKALVAIRLGVEDGPSNEDAFTLETLFANILDESRRYNTKETALYSSSSRKFGSSSKATKQKTKSPKRLNKKGPKDASKYCSYCKKEGYLEDDCYSKYPNKRPPYYKEPILITNEEGEEVDLLYALGNSGTITSYGVGNVRIRFKDTNKVSILTNCLYIPEFRLNLVSLSQLDTCNVYTRLKNGVIELFNSQNDLLTKAILNKSLYKLNISIPTSYSKEVKEEALYLESKSDAEIWHKRLGHIGDNTLKRLGVSAENISPTCEVCISSKHTRKISRAINEKAKSYLDKVSCDICGPIEPPTNKGYRYFISFIDNYTRYIEANLISRKSEAFSCFKDFKLRAENSDSNSSNKRPRLKNSSVKHELSSPYNPEQNGLIQRPNRTLLGKSEALEAAIFLYNRTPHSSLGFKSPYELRYNKPPNLDNIRIFGSIAYYTRVKAKKLDTRAKKAILIGSKNQISLDTPNNLLDSSSRNDDSRSTSISSNTLEGDELVDDLETVSKTPKTTLGDITSSRPTRTLEDDGLDDELSLYALIASNNSDDPTSYTEAINSPNKDD
ncbi:unnamed protein product [Cercospora beticola]|nr:unnamed protein product [Cercospora beticola]